MIVIQWLTALTAILCVGLGIRHSVKDNLSVSNAYLLTGLGFSAVTIVVAVVS